jgi:hypothetical protein
MNAAGSQAILKQRGERDHEAAMAELSEQRNLKKTRSPAQPTGR